MIKNIGVILAGLSVAVYAQAPDSIDGLAPFPANGVLRRGCRTHSASRRAMHSESTT